MEIILALILLIFEIQISIILNKLDDIIAFLMTFQEDDKNE